MMEFDGTRHVVYAALTPGETSIVGVGRFVRTPDPLGSAEVAIAVADAWQGAGLGSALLARLIEQARRTELRRLIAITRSGVLARQNRRHLHRVRAPARGAGGLRRASRGATLLMPELPECPFECLGRCFCAQAGARTIQLDVPGLHDRHQGPTR